jgi:hypothetical protein
MNDKNYIRDNMTKNNIKVSLGQGSELERITIVKHLTPTQRKEILLLLAQFKEVEMIDNWDDTIAMITGLLERR